MFSLSFFGVVVVSPAQQPFAVEHDNLAFTENVGQIRDQYNVARTDIQMVMHTEGLQLFVGNGAMHYQFTRAEIEHPVHGGGRKADVICAQNCAVYTYRMDVQLLGATTGMLPIYSNAETYYEHYCLADAQKTGKKAMRFENAVYKDVCPGIDWVLSTDGNKLEQSFTVHDGADAANIQMAFNGATELLLNPDNSVTAITPMGSITEKAPVCYTEDGKPVPAKFKISGNILSYDLMRAVPPGQSLVIDPTLEWGTFYGPDTNVSPLYDVAVDGLGNVYAAGMTYAGSTENIATTGAYLVTYQGNADAYLIKFDSSGNRLWGTYYGGIDLDWGYAVAADGHHSVYLAGFTMSNDSLLIATPGSLQPGNGGGGNGFLAKFDGNGDRLWATFYGGDQQDELYSVVCDGSNNVIIAGVATSTFNIATPGSFEDSFYNPGYQYTAGLLAKFDSVGDRLWGTYYKSFTDTFVVADVYNGSVATDGFNLYFSAWTDGGDSVTTPGTWQPDFQGTLSNVLLAKFNDSGARQWATFYGGSDQNNSGSVACDKIGNVYLMGMTTSDSAIASAGCFQPTRAGGWDIFLAKFDPANGSRIWGTYYGGPGDETISTTQIASGAAGYLYITGYTGSTTGIATAGVWQAVYGGGVNDAFLAAFDANDSEVWSTYYGGDGDDDAEACATDNVGIFMCGKSNSTNQIATTGAFDTVYHSGALYNKGFIAKFLDIDSALSIRKTVQPAVTLFPNPANDYITVSGLQGGECICLVNSIGTTLYSSKIEKNGSQYYNGTIAISSLPAGTYFIEILDSESCYKTALHFVKL